MENSSEHQNWLHIAGFKNPKTFESFQLLRALKLLCPLHMPTHDERLD